MEHLSVCPKHLSLAVTRYRHFFSVVITGRHSLMSLAATAAATVVGSWYNLIQEIEADAP